VAPVLVQKNDSEEQHFILSNYLKDKLMIKYFISYVTSALFKKLAHN